MTDQSKPDRQDGDGSCLHCGAPFPNHNFACPLRNSAVPARDAAEGGDEITADMAAAGRKALAVVADRMEEAKLLATSSIDFWQRVGHEPANEIYRAMLAAAPPQPAPDAVREVLFKREPRDGGYAFVTAPAFPGWSFMLTPVCPEAREQEMRLSLVAFLEAEVSFSAPVPSPDGAVQTLTEICRNKNCPRGGMPVEVVLPPSATGAAEPVAWQKRLAKPVDGSWTEWAECSVRDIEWLKKAVEPHLYETRALYATPPVRGDRRAIARAIFKNRQHLSDEDVSRWFALYADKPEGVDHFRMAIWRAYSDADAILSLPVQPGTGERAPRGMVSERT